MITFLNILTKMTKSSFVKNQLSDHYSVHASFFMDSKDKKSDILRDTIQLKNNPGMWFLPANEK